MVRSPLDARRGNVGLEPLVSAPARACGWLQTRDGFLILKNGRPRGRLARYDLPHRLRPREPEPPAEQRREEPEADGDGKFVIVLLDMKRAVWT